MSSLLLIAEIIAVGLVGYLAYSTLMNLLFIIDRGYHIPLSYKIKLPLWILLFLAGVIDTAADITYYSGHTAHEFWQYWVTGGVWTH